MRTTEKYSIVYSFQIHDNKAAEFIQNWKDLTEFIYKTYGSLGSRLHQIDEHNFFATAIWPNKDTFERCKNDNIIHNEAELIRVKQNSCVKERNIVFQGNVIEDLIKIEVDTIERV